MLSSKFISLNELQRFQGKCISLTLMVPAPQLYTRVVVHAISRCQKQGTPIPLDGDLREEILHWCFLDTWTGFVPWRTEEHRVFRTIASDASQSSWGASLSLANGIVSVGDYFGLDMDERDIATKEAHALLCALQAFSPRLTNARVDAMVDNQVLYHAWLREGCKNQGVNKALKSICVKTSRCHYSGYRVLSTRRTSPHGRGQMAMSWSHYHCGNVLRPSQDLIPSTLWLLTPTLNVLGIIRRSQHHAPRVPTFLLKTLVIPHKEITKMAIYFPPPS